MQRSIRFTILCITLILVAAMTGKTAFAAQTPGAMDTKLNSSLRFLRDLRQQTAAVKEKLPAAERAVIEQDFVVTSVKYNHVLTGSEITELERLGLSFYRFGGEIARTGTIYPVRIPWPMLETTAGRPEVLRIESSWNPMIRSPLNVSRHEIGADVTWNYTDPSSNQLTGTGMRIADFDTGIDVFHPSFFFPDGDTLDWIDDDLSGTFTPGSDYVDLNDNGTAEAGELLDYVDGWIYDPAGVFGPGTPSNNGNGYQAYWDWLYNDANGNGSRDFGTGAGYTESDPTFGELYFITLDENGNGRLDTGERLVALGTSKVVSTMNSGEVERQRGIDIIDSDEDTNGHGTAVSGILAGGVTGRHLFNGIAPDAELLMGYRFSGVSTSVLIPWARSWGADVMLHEYASWTWHYLDGSSLEEQLITTENATIIQVNAAGNLNAKDKVALLDVPGSSSRVLGLTVPASYGGSSILRYYTTILWRTNQSDLAFQLETPQGGMTWLTGGVIYVDGYYTWSDVSTSTKGTAKLDLYVANGSNPSVYGGWLLTIHNSTGSSIEVTGTISDHLSSWSGGATFSNYTTEQRTVTWPATADSSFVTASYSTRGWESYSGPGGGSIDPGEISSFSGRGARIDGHQVLDIASPGNYDVYSTLTHQGGSSYPLGSYDIFGGTSAAAPHTAGAAALVQQAFPAASMAQVAYRMTSTAATDAYTGFVYNNTWGWGKLRILAATTGIDASITVDSPNGGEVWEVGYDHSITWTTGGTTAPDSFSIFLSIDGGFSYPDTIVTGITGTSSYLWTVPNIPVVTTRVKVAAYSGGQVCAFDASDADFTIKGRYRYVSPSGGNIHPYTLPEWAAHTIEAAVDAADPDDTVQVATATYTEFVLVESPLYLLGGWDSTFTVRDPDTYVTTIKSSGGIVSFMNIGGGACGIEGFTLENGTGQSASLPLPGTYGGGIFSYSSSPVIRDNTFTNCGATTVMNFSGGGAIACYDGDVTIEDNSITGAEAQSGGGIYLYQCSATINGNRIEGSAPHAEFTGTKAGGGIYALHATVSLEDNVITDNDGYNQGGGIYLRLCTATVTGDSILLHDCLDTGGGIHSDHSSLEIDRAVILENTAVGGGGGINHRAENLGIENSIVALNESSLFGGGIYADSVWGEISNNTVDRNYGTFGGGNVFIVSVVSLVMKNNLITYGLKYGFQANSLTNLTYQYNNCFGNFPDDVFGVTPDTTNTSRNPHYADTTALDYHLLVHSGGIDTGDPAGAGDPDGSRADQGAFGGPGAVMAAPEYIQNLSASAVNDTTIRLTWDSQLPGGLDYYAIYGDTADGFLPSDTVFVGSTTPAQNTFDHTPVSGCWYYRVSAVNLSGYGGGYSNQAGDCSAGPDTIPPTVTVAYPNGGEVFEPGDTINIQWIATDNRGVDSVSIYYSDDGGGGYSLIAGGEPNDSLYQWVAPAVESDSCLVRVVAYDPSLLTGEDVSDSLFTIKSVTGDGDETPRYVYRLGQNYPNPFNPVTRISFSIGSDCHVSLRIYDVAGRLVRTLVDERRDAGNHVEIWHGRDGSGRNVASGIYFYSLAAGPFRETKKMVLLR
ncbi:MAG: S8 family serine peptidase [bacterium]|nr:MAG: S8 family serine peptidase [bacterium]